MEGAQQVHGTAFRLPRCPLGLDGRSCGGGRLLCVVRCSLLLEDHGSPLHAVGVSIEDSSHSKGANVLYWIYLHMK